MCFGGIIVDSVIKDRRDSVYIEAEYHPLYKQLTDGGDAPFKTMKDVFMTAMLLGYRLGAPRELVKRHMIFKTSAFIPGIDLPVLRAVALGPKGNVEAMISENQMLSIAEEYANAGFATLRAEVVDRPGVSMNNLVLLLTNLYEHHQVIDEAAVTQE